MANLLAVPIGADQSGRKAHGLVQVADGTARNASSRPAEPLMPAARTTHTTAERGSVPSEVTSGDPDVKPKVTLLSATSARYGLP